MRSVVVKPGLAAVAVLSLLSLLVSPAAGAARTAQAKANSSGHPYGKHADPLPLGPEGLEERRSVERLAKGLVRVRIVRGHTSPDAAWTVTVGLGTTEEQVAELERKVREAGYDPYRTPTAGPSPLGPPDEPLGRLVRVGRFEDRAGAEQLAKEMAEKGISGSVHYTPDDGHPTTGPWVVNVLVADAGEFRGDIRSALATGVVPGRERTSSIAAGEDAVAAVNGGYFVIENDPDAGPGAHHAGTEGDLGGISVVGGRLVSEAVQERPALVLPDATGEQARVRRLVTRLSVRAPDGASRPVNGLNRIPGLIVNCGGVGNLVPFNHPAHDYTCGNPDEIIAFTPSFGDTAVEGEDGYQVTLDGSGTVVSAKPSRGGPIPPEGRVLQGIGDGAKWLRKHAEVGADLDLRQRVADAETGERVAVRAGTSVVNGGPLLVDDGQVRLTPVRGGWSPEDIQGVDRASFYNAWYLRRNPRTAAGVTDEGKLLLVTVDGRAPGYSVGASIPEMARVMEHLGAVEALNLDGGGSTTMVVDGKLVTRPSDSTGERPVGGALVLVPGRR